MRVKCLAQEHNSMSPARARTRTPQSGIKRTNQEANAPPRNGPRPLYTAAFFSPESGGVGGIDNGPLYD